MNENKKLKDYTQQELKEFKCYWETAATASEDRIVVLEKEIAKRKEDLRTAWRNIGIAEVHCIRKKKSER